MSMTQGSDLFSVSRSSRALQDTRSSTLETQVAGPLRLVAGEVASWTSFILAQPAKQYGVRLVGSSEGVGKRSGGLKGLSRGVAHSQETGSFDLVQMSQKEQRFLLSPREPNQTQGVITACQSYPPPSPNEEYHLTSVIKRDRTWSWRLLGVWIRSLERFIKDVKSVTMLSTKICTKTLYCHCLHSIIFILLNKR